MSYARLSETLVTIRKPGVCTVCRRKVEAGQMAYVVRPPDGGPRSVRHASDRDCEQHAPAAQEDGDGPQ